MEKTMIACCGLTCSECPAFKATKTGDRSLAKTTAEQWSRDYGIKVAVDDVWCDGCIMPGRKCAHCAECEIRKCALSKGAANCAKCPGYGCETISNFFRIVPFAKETLDRIRATAK